MKRQTNLTREQYQKRQTATTSFTKDEISGKASNLSMRVTQLVSHHATKRKPGFSSAIYSHAVSTPPIPIIPFPHTKKAPESDAFVGGERGIPRLSPLAPSPITVQPIAHYTFVVRVSLLMLVKKLCLIINMLYFHLIRNQQLK